MTKMHYTSSKFAKFGFCLLIFENLDSLLLGLGVFRYWSFRPKKIRI